MKTLIVLSGCPGSGKSTLVIQIKNAIKADAIQIDEILNTFDFFTPEVYHEARNELIKITENCIKNSENEFIIVEDTNHLRSLVKPFRRLAKLFSIKFLHIVLTLPLQTALNRNSQREHCVNENILTKIHEQLSVEYFFSDSFLIESNEFLLEIVINQAVPNAKVMKVKEKQAETQNFYHKIDCEIRKKINSLVMDYTGNKAKYSARLIKEKKSIIQRLNNLTSENYDFILNQILDKIILIQ